MVNKNTIKNSSTNSYQEKVTNTCALLVSASTTGVSVSEIYSSSCNATQFFNYTEKVTGTFFSEKLIENYVKKSIFDSNIYKESILSFLNIINNNIG